MAHRFLFARAFLSSGISLGLLLLLSCAPLPGATPPSAPDGQKQPPTAPRKAQPSAAQVARLARQAQKAGLIVRAWELYAEAARLDPKNASYRVNRDLLANTAKLFSSQGLQKEEKSLDQLKEEAAEQPAEPDALDSFGLLEAVRVQYLLPPPQIKPTPGIHSFDLRGDEKALYLGVTSQYGVKVVFDPAFDLHPTLQFRLENVDFHTALEALTTVTDTFLFALSPDTIFVARDDQQKREKYEPEVALTLPLPEAIDAKDVNEAAIAVKGLLQSQRIMVDGAGRQVVIRDRLSRAYLARDLFQSLLLPKAQVALGFEFLALDDSTNLHYGLSLPTSYPVINLGHLGRFAPILDTSSGFTQFLSFGGGATLFGIGVASSNVFAISSKSWTRSLYDAQVIAGEGQPTTLHIGDKYPIAQALSTGYGLNGTSGVIPQTTQEDLGIQLKVTPHILGEGEVALDIEASYKTLGSKTFNTVPTVNMREFKGSVHLAEGEWAVIAGIDSESLTISRNGIVGLVDIPVLNHIFGENTRDRQSSRTMIVLKPRITRPRASETISPQFLSGAENGERVLL